MYARPAAVRRQAAKGSKWDHLRARLRVAVYASRLYDLVRRPWPLKGGGGWRRSEDTSLLRVGETDLFSTTHFLSSYTKSPLSVDGRKAAAPSKGSSTHTTVYTATQLEQLLEPHSADSRRTTVSGPSLPRKTAASQGAELEQWAQGVDRGVQR